MKIGRLDHINLHTRNLAPMVRWYEEVVGLTAGDRPNFRFKGAWLYSGDQAVVHLVEVPEYEFVGSEAALKMEHFALRAEGLAEFIELMEKRGEHYFRVDIPEINMVQINIWDPDGNHLHLDFPAD